MSEEEIKSYLVAHLEEFFPGLELVGTEELLMNRYRPDIHLRDENNNDVIIEIVAGELNKRKVGKILNYYSIIENLRPPLKKIRFIVIGERICEDAKRILRRFNIEPISLRELNVSIKEIKRYFYREDLKNVLTPMESDLLSHINDRECKLVDVDQVKEYLNLDEKYASKMLERLEEKRYLERIIRGKYLFMPLNYGYEERYPPMNSLIVGGVVDEPYYFGYLTANRYHGFTSQYSPKAYLCTLKPRRGFMWGNSSYVFVSLIREKFFGYMEAYVDGCKVSVAEPEKAVLDSLDKSEYCGGVAQVLSILYKALSVGIDRYKLASYAGKMGSNSVIQRLGYMSETLSDKGLIDVDESFLQSIYQLMPENVSNTHLGPVSVHGNRGPVNRRWRVVENVDEETRYSEIEVK